MLGKKLYKGATIGLVSPASPESPDKIKKCIETLTEMGYKVKEGRHVHDKLGYLAGSDEHRAEDLIDMFTDDEVNMILCIRGGYGTMRLLPLLDFSIIRNNPKIFAGFSDITTLLNCFNTRCGLVTFHAPMGSSNFSDVNTLKSFISTLEEGACPYKIENPSETPIKISIPGITIGKLVGGNLSLIASTLGTPYEVDFENNILFIEDVGEEPYKIDRMLTQLLLSGKLQKCNGFLLGQFTDCSLEHYDRSLTLGEVITDRLLSLRKPTLSNFMSGHSYPKLTLPIGAKVELDCLNGEINVLQPVVV